MELNMEEMDNEYDASKMKYWEQPQSNTVKTTNTVKTNKKVTFNDILNNMNLVVSKDGVLQYMTTKKVQPEQPYNYQQQPNNYQQQPYNYQQQPNNYQQQPYNYPQQQPDNSIDPSVKHSYIYNKYFKDYKNMNNASQQQQQVRKPKTIEEWKQMLREDKIKEIQRLARIEQIKPKSMFFTNINTSANKINVPKNDLNKMTFF